MAHYENGLDTQSKIISACKKLFYSRGFDATTYKDISAAADVNQALIAYYFKSKNALANRIFQHLMAEMMEQVGSFFPEEDDLTRYFISEFLYFRLIYEDPSFRNFMDVCCGNGSLSKNVIRLEDDFSRHYRAIVEMFNEYYIPDVTMQEGLLAIFEGMKVTYSMYICQNYEKMDSDTAVMNFITAYCRLLNISRSEYGPRMLQAALLSNKVEVSALDFDYAMYWHYHSTVNAV